MAEVRPTVFDQVMFDDICERLADGESLRSICRDENMPRKSAVFRWLKAFPDAADQYTRAREAQADALADEIVDIADNGAADFSEDGAFNSEAVQRARLRVDARKWVASKLKPKVYGDSMTHKGDAASPVALVTMLPSDKSL